MLKLDDWQLKFLQTTGNKILCTGRQVGKSVICGMDAGEFAMKTPNAVVLMIAPTERQAYALFEKTLRYISDLNPQMICKGKDRPTQTKINLKNGTKIFCLPVGLSGVGIRFLTINRLYADEASRIPVPVWDAVTPELLTTGGDMILLSTPFGKQGFFFDTWNNKDNNFTRFNVSSEKVMNERPICETWTQIQKDKALSFLASEQKDKTKLVYAQEYLGEFLDELRQLYKGELIRACTKDFPMSYSLNRTYFLGVDVARYGGDQNAFVITEYRDKIHMHIVYVETTENRSTTDTIGRIKNLNETWQFSKVLIDDGGIGGAVFDSLLNSPIGRKCIGINNAKKATDRDEGSKRLQKEDLYMNLLRLLEAGEVLLPDNKDLRDSLGSIQIEYSEEGNIKIFGKSTHIAEATIRSVYGAKQKGLNLYIE